MSDLSITNLLITTAHEFNELREGRARVPENAEEVLFGPGGALDSHGLVNFIVLVEEKLEDQFGKPIVIVSEKAMSRKHSPFRSLGAFAEFISEVLKSEA